MQKRKKVTYIGTTRPLPETFDVKKKVRAGASKHQLVLFAIQPFYAFTNHFVRVIEIVLQSFGPTHAVTKRIIRVIESRPEQTMTSMVPSLFFEEAIIQNILK